MAILYSSKSDGKRYQEVEEEQGNISLSRSATMGFRINIWGLKRNYNLSLSRAESEELRNTLDKWLSAPLSK